MIKVLWYGLNELIEQYLRLRSDCTEPSEFVIWTAREVHSSNPANF